MNLQNRTDIDAKKWPEIAIIGSYPPPYGGISVHIQRLAARLEQEKVDFKVYNTLSKAKKEPYVVSVSKNKFLWYLFFCAFHKCKVVHLLSTSWLSRLIFGLTASVRFGKYMLSIHGRSISTALDKPGTITAKLTGWVLRKMDVIIACNKNIEIECIEKVGLEQNKVRMIPAFIPPVPAQFDTLPACAKDFISKHKPVISAVGWTGQVYNGSDVYGIDMLIELTVRLKDSFPDVGLLVSINGGTAESIKKTLQQAENQLGDKALFITEAIENISPLLKASDVFVRPTNTDGDAVSVREAIFLGTPAIASNVVPRPEGCVVFENRDITSLEQKVLWTLANSEAVREKMRSCATIDSSTEIIKIYRELKE